MKSKPNPSDKRPKTVPSPNQVQYFVEQLRARLTELEASYDQIINLGLEKIPINNWASGSRGLELISNMTNEIVRELARIKDAQVLLGKATTKKKPDRKEGLG